MKVCLDLSPAVHQRGGIGRYAAELARALIQAYGSEDYVGFYNRASRVGNSSLPAGMQAYPVPWGDKPWRLRVMLAQMTGIAQDRLFPDIDVFHATDHLLPLLRRPVTVFTLQDLSWRLTDTAATWNRFFLRVMLPYFLRRADAVIVPSQSTRDDLRRLYRPDDTKMSVIPLGVSERFSPPSRPQIEIIRQKYHLPEHYILAVGTLEPRKNYGRLLAAYAAIKSQLLQMPLVIAGKLGWRYRDVFRTLEMLQLEHDLQWLDYVPEEDLPGLYAGSFMFVYPSLYEGFGLPVLEAMACGVPVIASDSSSLPEIVGDAGLLVPPEDMDALGDAILRLAADQLLRETLISRGHARVLRYSWTTTAQQTHALYTRLLEPQAS